MKDLEIGKLKVDLKGLVHIEGREISLTRKEKDILIFLLQNRSKSLSKEHLADVILGKDAAFLEDYTLVFTLMRRLIKRLSSEGCENYLVELEDGHYRMGV